MKSLPSVGGAVERVERLPPGSAPTAWEISAKRVAGSEKRVQGNGISSQAVAA